MQATKPKKSNGFRPDYIADSVLDIDYQKLASDNIKAMAFDVDGTLIDQKTVLKKSLRKTKKSI